MHININFILLQEFDVEYYFICFILILKVKFISKMKWKCIFSEISPQSNPLRELITPPTKLAGPGGRPCRPTGGDCRVSRADYVSTQPYRVHSLDNAKTGEYRRYMDGAIFPSRPSRPLPLQPSWDRRRPSSSCILNRFPSEREGRPATPRLL